MKSKARKVVSGSANVARQRQRRLNELIAKQGVSATATFEHLLGFGANLWDNDKDFNTFLQTVKAIRHEKG